MFSQSFVGIAAEKTTTCVRNKCSIFFAQPWSVSKDSCGYMHCCYIPYCTLYNMLTFSNLFFLEYTTKSLFSMKLLQLGAVPIIFLMKERAKLEFHIYHHQNIPSFYSDILQPLLSHGRCLPFTFFDVAFFLWVLITLECSAGDYCDLLCCRW